MTNLLNSQTLRLRRTCQWLIQYLIKHYLIIYQIHWLVHNKQLVEEPCVVSTFSIKLSYKIYLSLLFTSHWFWFFSFYVISFSTQGKPNKVILQKQVNSVIFLCNCLTPFAFARLPMWCNGPNWVRLSRLGPNLLDLSYDLHLV